MVADRDEGRVALDVKPSLVLAVDGVTSKRAVWTEAVEVLSMEIEVNSGDEQISLSEVSLATVIVRFLSGDYRVWSEEVELVLAAKEERRIVGVYAFDGEGIVRCGLFDEVKSPRRTRCRWSRY